MASSQGSSNGSGGSDGRSQNSAGKAKATCICGNNEGALCPVHPDHDPIAYDDDEVEAVPLCKKPKSEKDLAYLARRNPEETCVCTARQYDLIPRA